MIIDSCVQATEIRRRPAVQDLGEWTGKFNLNPLGKTYNLDARSIQNSGHCKDTGSRLWYGSQLSLAVICNANDEISSTG